MRLEVNQDKSAVARPEARLVLGFRRRREAQEGDVEVLLSKRSRERINARIREMTPRGWGSSLHVCILEVNAYPLGWLGFFGICTPAAERDFRQLDAHLRRRLRALRLEQWEKKRFIVRGRIKLGVNPKTAGRTIYEGHTCLPALSHTPAVERGLRNAYFAERGLVSLLERWKAEARYIDVPVQLSLALG